MDEKKYKILLVEDDPLIIKMYHAKFTRAGFKMETAFNGMEGLAKLETAKVMPDIILLDIMMPRMNGYELLKVLKKKKTFSSIPVIILSSLGADFSLVKKAESLGVNDTIVKSNMSLKEVVLRIRKAIKGEKMIPNAQENSKKVKKVAQPSQNTVIGVKKASVSTKVPKKAQNVVKKVTK